MDDGLMTKRLADFTLGDVLLLVTDLVLLLTAIVATAVVLFVILAIFDAYVLAPRRRRLAEADRAATKAKIYAKFKADEERRAARREQTDAVVRAMREAEEERRRRDPNNDHVLRF